MKEEVEDEYDDAEAGMTDDMNMMEGASHIPTRYDNEWVRFLDRITEDASMRPIVMFLASVKLTKRTQNKLITYTTTLLDREFAVSRIENREDYLRLLDKKHILDADLPLGLTRFDMTPDFQHVLDLINIKFEIKIRRSIGGFERKILATQRSESIVEQRDAPAPEQKASIARIKSTFRR